MKKIYSVFAVLFAVLVMSQTYTADFEAETKGGYASADLDIGSPAINWNLTDAVIGSLANDWFNGTKSLRLRGYSTSAATMNANKAGGIGQITFYYKQYGTDSQIPYNIDWSSDGTTWTNIGTITADATVQTFNYTLNEANARIRIIAVGGASTNMRMNIDDITITDNGSAGSPTITVNPTSIDFGNVILNATSSSESISVNGVNLSATPTYSITGTDAAMFSASGTLTTSGGTLNINFTPTSTGSKSATLTVTSGSVSETVSLSGYGVTADNPYGLDDSSPLGSLTEDFETGTSGSSTMPNNWVNVANLTDDRLWEVRSFSGNKYAQFTSYGGTGAYETLLISPAVDLDLIKKDGVTFDWNSGYADGAVLNVYVIQLNSGVMVKNLITSINDNTNTSGYGSAYTTVTLDLSTYSGAGFLAFEYVGDPSTPATTTYQIDNINIPSATAAVSEVDARKNNFIKATLIDDKIVFTTNAEVKIVNMNGQLVKSASVKKDSSLDVSGLANGVYVVVGTVDGKTVSQKIIKK